MEATELYQLYKPKLLGICRQYAKDDGVAEDLLHDAFVIILSSLDKLEDKNKVEPWMTSIVRNTCYHYRQLTNKEQSALHQLANEKQETNETAMTPDYDQLKLLVAQLPQGYQQVFRLSVFEGLSHQEISRTLGIAPHSSSSQLFHAKRMLRQMVKQSWVLILLLLAIPAYIWLFMQKKETKIENTQMAEKTIKIKQPEQPKAPKSSEPDAPIIINRMPSSKIILATPSVDAIDTATYQIVIPQIEEMQETNNQALVDTTEVEEQREVLPIRTLEPEQKLLAQTKKRSNPWNITLTYSGLGRNDDYLAAATIGDMSFDAASNTMLPASASNWIDYDFYLNTAPGIVMDAETRSLMNIAAQNSSINNGWIEARYEHKLPITLQVMLNRQLSKRLSVEAGLSYTNLNSTITTGSTRAYIQEEQRIHYLGIPVRINWQWLCKSKLCLYSGFGVMFETPIHSSLNITHMAGGQNTFGKSSTLSPSNQWSTSLGVGLQYKLTPNIGLYLEPSLQYFIPNSSSVETYRTEHPLELTLPIGVRISW